MKILKSILFIVLGLIGILLIAAAFIKKDYTVERSIEIKQSKAVVFDYLLSLKSQNDWSVWGSRDPNMKKEFFGTDKTVGFIAKWEGNSDVGSGEQEIKKIVDGERIDTELRFKEPFASTSQAFLITEMIDSMNTRVKWGFSGHSPYPQNIMNVVMDKMVGDDFQIGLTNLKKKLEQN